VSHFCACLFCGMCSSEYVLSEIFVGMFRGLFLVDVSCRDVAFSFVSSQWMFWEWLFGENSFGERFLRWVSSLADISFEYVFLVGS
jgi:hypothetical protein